MQKISEYKKFFSEELQKEIIKLGERQPYYLYEPVIYTLNMGGKRLRPVLLLMAYNLYSDRFEKVMPAAMAIELFHNFTLLHDDIMDDADLRRNMKTVHVKYSNNAAILSGDAMSILSYEYITKIETDHYREVMLLYTQTALQICEGQQFDMDFETRTDVSVEEYLNMIGLKTAVLMASSLKIGALMAGAPDQDCELLYEFGYNLGMAFQLQDDLLDSFGDQFSFGKNIGGDIVSNKKTYLMIMAFNLAQGHDLKELMRWTTVDSFDRQEKIAAVKDIFTKLGVVNLLRDKMDEYYQRSLECLERLSVVSDQKSELYKIARMLMRREN
jgi:geranylgeranyl diphosphate synthase, type II